MKEVFAEEVVFTHARDDLRQDGSLACELTWNAFRDHVVLECEVARIDGDLGCSNSGFPPVASGAEEKIARLHHHFANRVGKHRSDAGTSRGPTRLRGMEGRPRGMEADAAERYAETFTCRKLPLAG